MNFSTGPSLPLRSPDARLSLSVIHAVVEGRGNRGPVPSGLRQWEGASREGGLQVDTKDSGHSLGREDSRHQVMTHLGLIHEPVSKLRK